VDGSRLVTASGRWLTSLRPGAAGPDLLEKRKGLSPNSGSKEPVIQVDPPLCFQTSAGQVSPPGSYQPSLSTTRAVLPDAGEV
jgi:hypothetical protein